MKRRIFLSTTSAITAAGFLANESHAQGPDPAPAASPANAVAAASAAAVASTASPVTGYDYARPAIAEGSRLLFIGDSITDMKWGRNEKDRNHYLGHSYVYLIASRLGVDMPKADLAFFNRGNSGNRISHLKARWQKDVIEMKPDLLSVLVGVNDRHSLEAPEAFETWQADYRDCLSQARAANPKLRIVLLDPFVLKSGRLAKSGWQETRAVIDKLGLIVAELAIEFGATHIKTQKIFDAAADKASPAHWIWDGVHPLPQGHELIARSWVQALVPVR